MKKWAILLLFLLFPPAAVYANPVIVFDPVSGISFVMVVGSMLLVESIIIAFILFFYHMELIPSFVAVYAGNILMYFFLFLPVLSSTDKVATAELVIVAAEGIYIKIISFFDTFQLNDFRGLKWRVALISAIVGNALSYYIGAVVPW